MLAPTGRNRRAGELLGTGTPAAQIPQIIGQASEGLDSVPLIAEAVAALGRSRRTRLEGLAALIRGEIGPEDVGRRPAPGRAGAEGGMSADRG